MAVKVIRYCWLVLTGFVAWIFMHLVNRTKIVGRENLPGCRNCLVIANHLTMIDSWFVTMACVWPQMIWKPYLLPWHLPEEKNFLKKWPLKTMCWLWQCIPIHRGTGDFLRQLDLLTKKLHSSSVVIFPEGTRGRKPKSGELFRWTKGAAYLAYQAKATIVPVAIRGSEDILPIGKFLPRIGKRMVIIIDQPFEPTGLYQKEKSEVLDVISGLMKTRLQAILTSATLLFENKKPSSK